jgi:TetR/AcrR family transcriptional repressor of nem operon
MQFDPSIQRFVAESLRRWTALVEERFQAVIASYRPARPVSAREIAEILVSIIEGGFVFGRSYQDRSYVARQLKQFRLHLELLFGQPKFRKRTAKAAASSAARR